MAMGGDNILTYNQFLAGDYLTLFLKMEKTMDIQRGYIRLFRQFEEWEWYDNPFTKAIFIHCLLKANDKSKKWRDLTIKRGQLVTSYEKLAASNGMTIQQTRTVLKQLQSTDEIEYQSTNQYTLITVKKYNLYQASNIRKKEADIIPSNKPNGGQVTTTNNNIYNTKEYIYNTHTIEKNVCVENKNLSSEDLKILRKYAKENGARRIKPYVAELIKNGGYLDILKEEKERLAKLERQKAEEVIPPPEIENNETEEERQKAYEDFKAKVRKIKERNYDNTDSNKRDKRQIS